MYRIEWKKYLNSGRYRESQFEKRKQNVGQQELRTPFESDFGRVIFSSAIRRMHDKTQVMPLSTGDSVHTRLTHSLEVMSIAYSLGIALCRDEEFKKLYNKDAFQYERDIPMILKTAALVHDIGNPPFGHFGETVIQNYFKEHLEDPKFGEHFENLKITDKEKLDFTSFDGNAQGFRILTRLQYLGDLAGLNLTYATLAAYTKYPNTGDVNKAYIGSKKHGVFTSEDDVFQHMVESCDMIKTDGSYKRHPLSFLVEAADSISYNIMDIEDGLSMGWYKFDDIITFIKGQCDQPGGLKYDEINNALKIDEIRKYKLDEKEQMAAFRVAVVSRQVNKAIETFKKNLKEIDEGSYSEELIEDGDGFSTILQDFAKTYIFPNKQIEQIELTGHSVLTGLLEKLRFYAFNTDKKIRDKFKSVVSKSAIKVAMHTIDKDIEPSKYKYYSDLSLLTFDLDKVDDYLKLRIIVDFISGMTDKYAVSLYQKLCGLKL